jgi:hypothetical protein
MVSYSLPLYLSSLHISSGRDVWAMNSCAQVRAGECSCVDGLLSARFWGRRGPHGARPFCLLQRRGFRGGAKPGPLLWPGTGDRGCNPALNAFVAFGGRGVMADGCGH